MLLVQMCGSEFWRLGDQDDEASGGSSEDCFQGYTLPTSYSYSSDKEGL